MNTTLRTLIRLEQKGFRNLLILLLVYIFASPFLEPYRQLNILAHLFLSVTLFVALFTIQRQQGRRSLASILLLVLLVLYWLGIYDVIQFSRQGSYLLFIAYFSLLIYSYIREFSRFQRVTLEILYGTLCLYLIIGLFWGSLYTLLNELQPGSYGGTLLDNAEGSKLHIFNYFSMVTLTTLGYGDITPQTPGAGSLCQLEAIIGQFFTAVIVGWMVGNVVSENKESGDEDA
jgi:hypothetical protein